MNSLERAKRFVASKASRLAIAVVPLAALAIAAPHAKANEVLSPNSNCISPYGSGSCSTSQTSPSGGDPEMNWIALTGSGLAGPGFENIGYNLDFTISGGASGSLAAGSIPVSWDFTINPAIPDPTVGWQVVFTLFLSNGTGNSFFASGSAATGTTVQGTGSINYLGQSIEGYEISLQTGSDSQYSIDIPGSSLDLNPGNAVPEPSSLLVISAAGTLIFLRRRKRT